MAQAETEILKRVMLAARSAGLVLFRNNRGLFYTMDTVRSLISAALSLNITKIKDAINRLRKVRAGVDIDGSSDLIGWHIATGKFAAVEIKTPTGRLSEEQKNFLDQVTKAGGIGIVCRDEKNLKELVDNALKSK